MACRRYAESSLTVTSFCLSRDRQTVPFRWHVLPRPEDG